MPLSHTQPWQQLASRSFSIRLLPTYLHTGIKTRLFRWYIYLDLVLSMQPDKSLPFNGAVQPIHFSVFYFLGLPFFLFLFLFLCLMSFSPLLLFFSKLGKYFDYATLILWCCWTFHFSYYIFQLWIFCFKGNLSPRWSSVVFYSLSFSPFNQFSSFLWTYLCWLLWSLCLLGWCRGWGWWKFLFDFSFSARATPFLFRSMSHNFVLKMDSLAMDRSGFGFWFFFFFTPESCQYC